MSQPASQIPSDPVSADAGAARKRPRRRAARRNPGATRILVGITLLGGAMFIGSAAVVGYLATQEDSGDVNEGSYLHVRLSGPLSDAPRDGGIFTDPEDLPPLTTEYAVAIRKAATDDRISGLYLHLDNPAAGWASYREIRDAIGVLQANGKPCVAYSEVWGNGSYYLASACDQVLMAPAGINMVNGLNASITYYAGTFEKIGVDAEMLHVGDFKSAVEPFERTGPSEPASQAMNYLLDGLYDEMVAGIAEGRSLDEAAVRAFINAPPMNPNDALAAGMVDGLVFRDAVVHNIKGATDDGWVATLSEPYTERSTDDLKKDFTSIKEYLKGIRYEQNSKDERIAVIYAQGNIVSGDPDGGLFGSSNVLADRPFRRWMREARQNEDVKAVVVRVNSPGGSGLASDMMWHEVELTKAAGKPVVVSMGDYAASGGYYISAPADWIVAQPQTLTGSIGVFGGKLNFAGTYEKVGMTSHAYKRGELSDLFSTSEPFSDEGRVVYQRFLDSFYEAFLTRVGDGRSLDRDSAHAVAQGRVWTGTQALERGLVDEIGGLDVALNKAAELASLDDYGTLNLPRQKSFVEVLIEDMNKATMGPVNVELDLGLPGVDDQHVRDLMLLADILEDGPAAMLPGRLIIE